MADLKKLPSVFYGLSVGVNGATHQESLASNVQGSAAIVPEGDGGADGIGGGGGAMTHVSANGGPGAVYPFGYLTAGAGWQISAGPSWSMDLGAKIASYWDDVFG